MDGVRMTLGERVMSVEHGRLEALDRKRWESTVRRSSVKMRSICMCMHCVEVCSLHRVTYPLKTHFSRFFVFSGLLCLN